MKNKILSLRIPKYQVEDFLDILEKKGLTESEAKKIMFVDFLKKYKNKTDNEEN